MNIKASKGKHAKQANGVDEAATQGSSTIEAPPAEQTQKAALAAPASMSGQPFQQTEYMPAVAGEVAAPFSRSGYETGYEPAFDMMASKANKKKRRKKALKGVGITLASLVGLIVVVYVAGSVFFMDHFMPNTTLGTYDVSLKSSDEAQQIVSEGIGDYQLKVDGQGLSFTLSAADADISADGASIVKNALTSVNAWKWPLEITKTHDVTESLVASSNEESLSADIQARVDEFNASAVPPTNATVAFEDRVQGFVVVPEEPGTALDAAAVTEAVNDALRKLDTSVTITADALAQPTVLESEPALHEMCSAANTMITADLTLTLGGAEAVKVDPSVTSSWVTFGDDLSVGLNQDAMNAWVQDVASKCDTVGTERTYTRPDGKVVTVSGGSYGWEIDNEALVNMVRDGVTAGQVATLEIPTVQNGNGFTQLGGQDWGKRYIDVDLSEQHARFYNENGDIIWETDIISGKPNGTLDTPTGVYYINNKESPSKLIGQIVPSTGKPEYETVVSYWMPFVGNYVGLHDATWQPDFGGNMYAEGYGSHGCINISYSAAASLWDLCVIGDVVITHF